LTQSQLSPPHLEERPVARALAVMVGIVTAVAGVAGSLVWTGVAATGAELPFPLDGLLATHQLSLVAVAALSAAAAAGGILWLRGAPAGMPLCSGTWAILAALLARPDVRFNYAEQALPLVEFPSQGRTAAVILGFAAAAALAILTHAFSVATRHDRSRLDSTGGETLAGTFFLVSGLSVSMRFWIDAGTVGAPAYEHALLPSLAAAIACEALGLGLLLGLAVARALTIAVLLGTLIGAFAPDVFLDRLQVNAPVFWAAVCALGAGALLVPRRLRDASATLHPT
jgi:hypothetical protein